ncbi:beta/gamma crystallin family protein [Bacillus sp. Marseille-Q3570]|uniref:beta/gamma crystallin family protein n=1 Tax=Bacillus sp. Marseille-Q3570 TaxID=2963522 RepID=UPI0021B75CCD|nr:beta/gamma crystallin family protein [Bacillus sp. Marseille-Q3570]
MSNGIDITLYEHEDLTGNTKHIQKPQGHRTWQKDLHQQGWGDKVSSIVVRSGWIALFEHQNFNGSIIKLKPGSEIYRLGANGWDNVVSSYIACDTNFDPVEMAGWVRRQRV